MPFFNKDMTISQAIAVHPRAKEVFAGFHLGGCAHCHVAEYETIEQVCDGYGVPINIFLLTLEKLFEDDSHA